MSDNLKIQKFKIIIIEKFCQKLKVCYFYYFICERQLEDNSGRFLCIVKARSFNFFGTLSNQGLCHLGSLANRTQTFSKIKIRNKKQLFGLRQKHLSYNSI